MQLRIVLCQWSDIFGNAPNTTIETSDASKYITQLCVKAGLKIDGFGNITFNNGESYPKMYGGPGGNLRCVNLNDNECISYVNVTYRYWAVDALSFITDTSIKYGQWGSSTMESNLITKLIGGKDKCLSKVALNYGTWYIYGIQFYFITKTNNDNSANNNWIMIVIGILIGIVLIAIVIISVFFRLKNKQVKLDNERMNDEPGNIPSNLKSINDYENEGKTVDNNEGKEGIKVKEEVNNVNKEVNNTINNDSDTEMLYDNENNTTKNYGDTQTTTNNGNTIGNV